eukprot:CAMPEP_0181074462 /NCGR_PEP_ID=MMETSP1070-20121207/29612_1 /TAXON_ID=265543 /ORGANISM="Minutocellus polymorphus, Strain NH13" /LENGTH=328 /DNA_ID=CAMNT_0023155575 /DNA_START=12 /DNA_END=998 /DNA_ORIENTATION=+
MAPRPRHVNDCGSSSAAENYGLSPPPRIYPNRMSRIVNFARRTRVYLVPTLEEMTNQEFYAVYGSDEDCRINQEGVVGSIRNMRLGVQESDDTYTCRGLEHMRSQAHMDQRKMNKEMLFDAILDEQDRQISEGIVDGEALAEVAARMSQRTRDAALALASSDEAYVRRYLKEEEMAAKEAASDAEKERESKQAQDANCVAVLGSALDVAPPTLNATNNNSSLPQTNRRRAAPGLNRSSPSDNTFLPASTSKSSTKVPATTKTASTTTTTTTTNNNISKSKSVEAMLNQMSIRAPSSAVHKTAASTTTQTVATSALGGVFSHRSRALST